MIKTAAATVTAKGMTLKKVNALKDDSGHWYVVPEALVIEFHNLLNLSAGKGEKAEQAEDEFIEKFSQYMTGGDLNNVQLYAEI